MGNTTTVDERAARVDDPGFGRYFTDHMAVARWRDGGWGDLELMPFQELTLSPAASVLHYGQAVFEGLKAVGQPDGGLALFRVDAHAQRFSRSAARLAMPPLPADVFVEACCQVASADREWAPSRLGHSLYLRPMMIATQASLGVRPADEYLFATIASPAAPFFSAEVRPISLMVADRAVRAAAGGTGAAKCSGNYAASLRAKQEAVEAGCDEVVWLDAIEHRWVEELSGMNVFLVERRTGSAPTLVTPPAGDTILDGITRSSLLALAPSLGVTVEEAPIAIDDIAGRATEAFASGTAAVVAPIGSLRTRAGVSVVGDGGPGPVTMRLRETLIAVQEGRADDPYGWRTPV